MTGIGGTGRADGSGGAGRYDALLLTGGAGRRMGRADKPALAVGDRPLVLRAAGALRGAARLVVVGPGHPDLAAYAVVREEPAGGGPVAALAAGAAYLTAPLVAVLAADLPFVTTDVVEQLAGATAGHDLALLVDDTGRDQHLLAVWRTGALRAALDAVGPPAGVSVRRLVAAAGDPVRVTARGDPTSAPPWFDCDTPEDLRRARRLAGRLGQP